MRGARRSRRRQSESGQMLLVTAMMSTILIGASAVAVDLSSQGSTHRNLQNWADTAAISGVRACDSSCNAQTEVATALQIVLENSPWSASSSWASGATSGCSASSCVVSNLSGPAGYTGYAVSASSPPASPTDSAYNTTSYLQVDVTSTTTTSFGAVIGIGTTLSRGHAIAYDSGPPSGGEFTFFAKVQAGSGNHVETIYGDAFLGGGYSPQSHGKSALCIYELPQPESSSSDTDGDTGGNQDNDLDDQGHAVFSAVPPSVGPDPQYGLANDDPTGYGATTCPGSGTLAIQQPQPTSNTQCPSGSTATRYTPSGGGTNYLCYEATPPYPKIAAPVVTSKTALCNTSVDSSVTPGVYSVGANCSLTLDMSRGNINCVSFVLGSGATVNITNKKGQAYVSSYGFNPTGDGPADADIANLGASVPSSACGGSSIPEDRAVLWAADTSTSPMPVALSNGTTGCCSDTLFLGTVYLPDQQISFATNQAMEDAGSIYCGQWDVQSGNHPNPVVNWDASSQGVVLPTLRLVE